MWTAAKALKEIHNANYPTRKENQKAEKFYRGNAPERLHDSHMQTLYLLLMDWSDDQEQARARDGQEYVSLALKTNNAKAQKGKRDKRTTSRHLARLAEAGYLISETCDKSREFPKGIKPKKIFHGSNVGYTVFLSPEFARAATTLPAFKGLLNPLSGAIMETNCPDNIEDKTNQLTISKKVSVPDVCNEDKRQKTNESKLQRSEEAVKEIPAAAAKNYTLTLHAELAQSGQLIIAYAMMIIDAYIKKLAPAMSMQIHDNERKRAMSQAIRLLKTATDLENMVDRICTTIDHMHGWIGKNPNKNFVPLPSYWFNPDYRFNIWTAEKKYYLPYLQKGLVWKEQREKKAKEDKSYQDRNDSKKMRRSGYHNLAGQLKTAFRNHHPQDTRLFSADLNKWAEHLRLLIENDKRSPGEVVAVANWLLNSGSKKAAYWMKDAGGYGIRSASGFRRNYTSILQQYGQDKAKSHGHDRK